MPISASNLMFGRWTSLTGASITDYSNLPPYLNLSNRKQEVETALNEIVQEIYDEEPQNF